MGQRERQELDRHITGNFGEDQIDQDFEVFIQAAGEMYAIIQEWRITGKQPRFQLLTETHDKLGAALSSYGTK